MKASTLFLSLTLSVGLFACGPDATPPTANIEQVTALIGQDQVLAAQAPAQVLSANLSHQDLQVVTTDQVPQARFASLAEAPCATCGNGIWGVFNMSRQTQLLVAFVAFLVLSAALYVRHTQHRSSAITTH